MSRRPFQPVNLSAEATQHDAAIFARAVDDSLGYAIARLTDEYQPLHKVIGTDLSPYRRAAVISRLRDRRDVEWWEDRERTLIRKR